MIKIILPIIIIVVVLASGYIGFKQIAQIKGGTPPPSSISTPASSPTSPELKTFQSKIMKFSINLPVEYQANERLGSVTVTTKAGEIYIDRNGTNFEGLDDYLKDLSEKNKFTLTEKKTLSINGLSAVSGSIGNEKIYFVYKDYFVYTLTAKSQPLYSDLDQIAKSFRYIP